MLRQTPRRSLLALLAVAFLLWGTPATAGGPDPERGLVDFTALAPSSGLQVCDGPPEPAPQRAKWRKKRNVLLTRGAGPRHVAEDSIALPGAQVDLRAKFTYGRVSKDLRDEDVIVTMHDCKRWKPVGQGTTDSDGWLKVSSQAPTEPGVYALAFSVKGDQSQVFGRLWVLPKGRRLVVLDIDGTLTTDDDQIKQEVLEDHFNKIGAGKHDPKMWPGAVQLTRSLARRGDVLVYLSGRPYWLIAHSRHWLDAHGFAPGMVLHTRSHSEVAPDVAGVGTFKRDRIRSLKASGFDVAQGYGNASTDVWAYRSAGIPADQTWIIGPLADKGKAHDVRVGWEGVAKTPLAPPPK